jgi:hypothetical protein
VEAKVTTVLDERGSPQQILAIVRDLTDA